MATVQVADIVASDDTDAERKRARRGTMITLGLLLALVTLVVLLTPVTDDASDTRLTTLKYGPGNAKLASDLARRLGWQVRTRSTPLSGVLDSNVIYAVFAGPTPMSPAERRVLQDAVTRGAGMLIAPSGSEPSRLLQSLGLRQGPAGFVGATPLGKCPPETDAFSALRVRSRMLTFDTAAAAPNESATPVPYPRNARTLLSSEVSVSDDGSNDDLVDATPAVKPAPDSAKATKEMRPTVVAFPLGRGRVVALADPDLLRTDQMRNCSMGSALTIVRSLEYLSEGRDRTIVFAEYYQGVRSDGPGVVLWEWLRGTGLGRMLLTMIAACMVLLLARGRRTLAPVYRLREERRSALEHVDALATAWQAVRGTRTVARMLARGIRRRHAAGRWRTLDDAAFLAALAERHPVIADDVARLSLAMESPAAPNDLPALRKAAAHIDAECLT